MIALLRQLGRFTRQTGKFWMLPLVVFLVVLGGILIVAQNSAVAPLIYAIF